MRTKGVLLQEVEYVGMTLRAMPVLLDQDPCTGCTLREHGTCDKVPRCVHNNLVWVDITKLDEYHAARVAQKLTA